MAGQTKIKKERSIASIKRERTVRLSKLIARVYYLHKRGRDEELYNTICNEFVSLGGVYVKFLQGVMLGSPIMKKWSSAKRLQIFEQLDPQPLDVIKILKTELSAKHLSQIALVQPQPFAAGSFGQVYYGQLVSGQRIIIKVLRPQVRELLRHDLRLLNLFSKRFVGKEYPNISIKMSDAVKDFRASTMRETDYVAESLFANEMYEAYKDSQQIVVPKTYMELSTEHIIVQDYVNGVSFVDLVRLKEQGGDPKAYVSEKLGSDLDVQLESFGVEFLSSIFSLPRIHGDPHPGNIRLLADNKVGLIDFGISANAPPHKAALFGIIQEWNRVYAQNSAEDLGDLFEQFMRFFVNDLYKALKKLNTFGRRPVAPVRGSAVKEVTRIVQEIFASAIGTTDIRSIIEDGHMLKIFNQMVNKGNRFGLVVRLNAAETLRAMQTYMNLVHSVGKRNVILPRVFDRVVERVSREHPELNHQTDDNISIGEAVETINRWLERVALRDPTLFRQLMNQINLTGDSNAAEERIINV